MNEKNISDFLKPSSVSSVSKSIVDAMLMPMEELAEAGFLQGLEVMAKSGIISSEDESKLKAQFLAAKKKAAESKKTAAGGKSPEQVEADALRCFREMNRVGLLDMSAQEKIADIVDRQVTAWRLNHTHAEWVGK